LRVAHPSQTARLSTPGGPAPGRRVTPPRMGRCSCRQRGDAIVVAHSTLMRPVLIIDEAQEALTTVLTVLRLLASKDFASKQLLCAVFAGAARLPERLRTAELLPLGSRIRRRLVLDYASRDELLACLDHLLEAAGNPSLMTTELKATL